MATRRPGSGWRGAALLAAAALLLAGAERGVRTARARLELPTGGARWIWLAGDWGRNLEPAAFLAAADFTLDAVPASARLLVIADEEYRLYLNGRLLGANRYRSSAPLDGYEVAPLLRPAGNRLGVELRSARGAGGLLLSLRAGETALAASGSSWKLFRRETAGVVEGWRPLAEGEAPLVWGLPPTGRWGVPAAPTAARAARSAVSPAERRAPRVLRGALGPAGGSDGRGAWALFDWGEPVAGWLRLRFADAGGGRALVLTGEAPPLSPSQPMAVAVALPGSAIWDDAQPRSLRYALVVADRDLAGADLAPGAASDPPADLPVAEEPGLLGVHPPPARSAIEEALWRRLLEILPEIGEVGSS